MIPAWKIQRELETLSQQLQSLPERLIGPARQRRLDREFPASVRVDEGGAPLTDKVAIFLVYQPHGMAASVLATCQHLARQGYAVLLVANTPVSAEDRQALRDTIADGCRKEFRIRLRSVFLFVSGLMGGPPKDEPDASHGNEEHESGDEERQVRREAPLAPWALVRRR